VSVCLFTRTNVGDAKARRPERKKGKEWRRGRNRIRFRVCVRSIEKKLIDQKALWLAWRHGLDGTFFL